MRRLPSCETLPPGRPLKDSPAFVLELQDQSGKPLLHLSEVGAPVQDRLRLSIQEKTSTLALVPQAPFRQWQEEMRRLTVSAEPARGQGERGKGGKE